MVLSLAFILAFIGSAVALLIGILIFSEVAEAMSATLPEILVEIPRDDIWFGAEHCLISSCDQAGFEYRIVLDDGTFFGGAFSSIDGVKLRAETNASTATQGYMFKVFDKAELDGKLIIVELSHDFTGGGKAQLQLFDGEFDPVPTGACGVDCFPATFKPDTVVSPPIVTSGSGGVKTLFNSLCGQTGCFTSVRFLSGSADLSSFDSPTGKVTLAIQQLESGSSASARTTIFTIDIEDHGVYNFRNDPQDPTWNGAVVTCHRECNTSTSNPSTYFSLTSFPPPPLPVFNSEDTLNANATFNNALNIGFTVVGILPVALFFALFAIFSGRTE